MMLMMRRRHTEQSVRARRARAGWKSGLTRAAVCACVALHLVMLPLSHAVANDGSVTEDLVPGAACFLLTPVYGAFKLAFAGAGAITGGLAWVFTGGDEDPAQQIWTASMRGTYVITPEHLRGEKPVRFVGVTGDSRTGSMARAGGPESPPAAQVVR